MAEERPAGLRLHPSMVRCKREGSCKLFKQGVCIYNHDEEKAKGKGAGAPEPYWQELTPSPAKGKGGKGKGKDWTTKGKGWGGTMLKYERIPDTAKAVTLYGESGYFIPNTSIMGLDGSPPAVLPSAPLPPRAPKRPAPGPSLVTAPVARTDWLDTPAPPARNERLHPSQVPCKRGAACRLFQQGVCIYNHDAEGGGPPPMPRERDWGGGMPKLMRVE
jgi:hypothetical protein